MNQASPGMAYTDIAASAYRAYAASTGNKNYRGEPMPEFESLPQAIQTAWEAAIRQVEICLRPNYGVIDEHKDEQRWAGWIPPHIKADREKASRKNQ